MDVKTPHSIIFCAGTLKPHTAYVGAGTLKPKNQLANEKRLSDSKYHAWTTHKKTPKKQNKTSKQTNKQNKTKQKRVTRTAHKTTGGHTHTDTMILIYPQVTKLEVGAEHR